MFLVNRRATLLCVEKILQFCVIKMNAVKVELQKSTLCVLCPVDVLMVEVEGEIKGLVDRKSLEISRNKMLFLRSMSEDSNRRKG